MSWTREQTEISRDELEERTDRSVEMSWKRGQTQRSVEMGLRRVSTERNGQLTCDTLKLTILSSDSEGFPWVDLHQDYLWTQSNQVRNQFLNFKITHACYMELHYCVYSRQHLLFICHENIVKGMDKKDKQLIKPTPWQNYMALYGYELSRIIKIEKNITFYNPAQGLCCTGVGYSPSFYFFICLQ